MSRPLGYGDSWGSRAPKLTAFLGPKGSAYLCARVSDIPETEVISMEQRNCARCNQPVWFDSHSYAVATEMGEAKIVCTYCMEDLLK